MQQFSPVILFKSPWCTPFYCGYCHHVGIVATPKEVSSRYFHL